MADRLLVMDLTVMGPTRSTPMFVKEGEGYCKISGRTAIFVPVTVYEHFGMAFGIDNPCLVT